MKKLVFGVFILLSAFTCQNDVALAATHYFSTVRNSTGDSVSGATVSVYLAGTVTPVSIFSNALGTISKSNPFLSDANGSYDFYVESGLYKVVVSKIGVGTFTTDNILIGIIDHATTHQSGGGDELLLSTLGGTVNSSQMADSSILNIDISPSAAISESKLSLNFATHSNINDPTTDQKAALGGTSSLPSGANKYVTNSDSRNTNARTPTAHAASHTDGGIDEVSVTTGQLSGVHAGTNLTSDLEEETHATEHQDGGADEISVAGLSGELSSAQKSEVLLNGASVGTRTKINLIEGTDIDLTVADNVGQNRVDITVNSTASTGAAAPIEVYEGITPIVTETSRLTFNPAQFNLSDTGSNRVSIGWEPPSYYPVTFLGDSPVNSASFNVFTDESDFSLAFNYLGPGVAEGEWLPKLSVFPCYQNTSAFVTGGTGGDGGDSVNLPPYDPWPFGCDNTSELNAPFEGQVLVFDGVDRTDVNHAWHNRWSPTICINDAACEAGKWISFSSIFTLEDTVSGNGEPVQIGLDEETLRDSQKIRGRSITTDVPTDGQTLLYNNGSGSWVYGTGAVDLEISYIIPLISQDDFTNINTIRFVDPIVVENPSAGVVTVHLGPLSDYEVNSIKDNHIDWGTGIEEVNTDDIPNGSSTSLIPSAQLTELTTSGNTGLHYHSSDRALANATGTLPAAQVGNGLTDAQVLNNLSVSSSGNVDAAAINSGTLSTLRLGNQKYQTKSIMVPYPDSFLNVAFGNVYMPVASTITQIVGRIRETATGGNCTFHVKIDSTAALASPLAADSDGEITNTILNPSIGAGTWMNFIITGCTAANDASELSITVVYLVN